ncbi:MAG: hypothetical protein IT180_19030 [Acidobacteria bacterium]|nr:hypothetical protein [Acidobacteriota bacterium]
MADDEIDIAAGEIPVTCGCGAVYVWRVNVGETLPPCCPACASTDTENSDTGAP